MTAPLVVAWTGNSHTIAQILCSLLTEAGIPAQVAGDGLMDEFALATRMSGGLGQILVPPACLDEARRILTEHEERGPLPESFDVSEGSDEGV